MAPYDRVAYVSFNLTGLASTSITSATLRLFGSLENGNDQSFAVNVLAVASGPVNQATLTFNNAPPTGAVLASSTVPNQTPQWYAFDLSSYLQQQLAAGAMQVTFAIVGTANTVQYAAFNGNAAASNQPQLVIS